MQLLFFFNDTATTEIYTLSLHDALPISSPIRRRGAFERTRSRRRPREPDQSIERSEEHTSELQSQSNLVCRLLLEKKKNTSRLCRCRRKKIRTAPLSGSTRLTHAPGETN